MNAAATHFQQVPSSPSDMERDMELLEWQEPVEWSDPNETGSTMTEGEGMSSREHDRLVDINPAHISLSANLSSEPQIVSWQAYGEPLKDQGGYVAHERAQKYFRTHLPTDSEPTRNFFPLLFIAVLTLRYFVSCNIALHMAIGSEEQLGMEAGPVDWELHQWHRDRRRLPGDRRGPPPTYDQAVGDAPPEYSPTWEATGNGPVGGVRVLRHAPHRGERASLQIRTTPEHDASVKPFPPPDDPPPYSD